MNREGIVIIPAWYPTRTDPVSGIFIRQQAKALHAAGLKISVFFVEEQGWSWLHSRSRVWSGPEEGVATFRRKVFVPPKRIRSLRGIWLRQWDQLMRAYRDHHGGYPELLHAHSFVGGAAAHFLSEKYGIPFVVTEHYSGFINGTIPRHWEKELREIYRAASKVIAVSPALAAAMSPYVSEVAVIPNMIDTGLFRPAEPAFSTSEIRRIISVGSLIPRKNMETLLHVFAQLQKQQPLELVIIGAGSLDHKLEQLARRLKVDQAVNFMGALSPAEVAVQLQSAQLYISASRAESFAVAPVEALACGLPVVMMRCGSILESRRFDGVTVVNKELELMSAMVAQLEALDQINRWALHEQIKTVFAPEVIVSQLREVYARLLGSSP